MGGWIVNSSWIEGEEIQQSHYKFQLLTVLTYRQFPTKIKAPQ